MYCGTCNQYKSNGGQNGMKKKSFSILLTALLTFSVMLSACSGGNNSSKEKNDPAPTTNGGDTTAAVVEPEAPTEIKIMLPLNTTDTPPDTIKTELEKLTNTKLTYQFFPADSYEEK